MVPARFPEVLAIASTTAANGSSGACGSVAKDTASYFTTDGAFNTTTNVGVTVSAPGEDQENVKGCILQSVGILSTKLGGGTTRMSGTSMAAPHATGVVALLQQKTPGITAETVRSQLRSGADRVNTAPLNSPTSSDSFDGEQEGVLWAAGALNN